jgi:putative membrane protein
MGINVVGNSIVHNLNGLSGDTCAAVHLRRFAAQIDNQPENPMQMLANVLAALVALLHLYFLVLEMFFWTKPLGRKAFGLDKDFAERSKALAANQGLYNGFLVAGLVYGLVLGAADAGKPWLAFFLGCVVVAGVFGAATVSRKILFVQAVPALLALAALMLI